MDYVELDISLTPFSPWNEIVVTELAELGFESFTENNGKVQAYIQKSQFNEELLTTSSVLDRIKKESNMTYTLNIIPSQNWNATWEADFKPVVIDDKAIIKAPFHKVDQSYPFEFIIQPQMSFGTGHHQTTYLISKLLLGQSLTNQAVLDVGTGTGILAIITKKLGASKVIGTEIDEQSLENAKENSERNGFYDIEFLLGDISIVKHQGFDTIIANINKNVLLKHLPHYEKRAKKGTKLILSGFYETDTDEIINFAQKYNFIHCSTFTKESWAVVELKYN